MSNYDKFTDRPAPDDQPQFESFEPPDFRSNGTHGTHGTYRTPCIEEGEPQKPHWFWRLLSFVSGVGLLTLAMYGWQHLDMNPLVAIVVGIIGMCWIGWAINGKFDDAQEN